MKILWLTWKDLKNPLAGGAEVVNEELAKRMVKEGHEVILLTGGFDGAPSEEVIAGYKVIRVGNRWTVYWQAYRYYKKHLRGWADLVIDEVNTVPFFAKFYVKEPTILFAHMLCRQIWFYELFFPLSLIGYILEPLYMRLLNDQKTITVSESTRQDLMSCGFPKDNIAIISEGITLIPMAKPDSGAKYGNPTILSLGSIRPMKKTLDQIKAFELAKQQLPQLKMKVAGDASGRYGQKVLDYIKASPYADDIEYLGRISPEQKIELMQKCHVITVTSVKEGWGLIVTEAASQGTPAAVYNVDGLRDSVKDGETGLISASNTPAGLANSLIPLFSDNHKYDKIREKAWDCSKSVTFTQSFKDFKEAAL